MASAFSGTDWTFVISEIIKSAVGICILLAMQACYFLNRRAASGRGVLICAMIVACSFAILQMGYQVVFTAMFVRLLRSVEIAETISDRQRLQGSFQHLSQVKGQWDSIIIVSNKLIIGLPLFLLVSTTIFGIVTSASPPSNSAINPGGGNELNLVLVAFGMISTNILLTSLTTGRNLKKLAQRYNTVIAVLLESSALYLVLVLTVVLTKSIGGITATESHAISALIGSGGQLMNLVPALVIVRVSLGRSIYVDPTAAAQSPV
ncbi:hypothetical protein B0H14DRAFT_2843644 [Mycena olivaceomarginata]|nr:hypothetical protein B0H14DRAFT_2843644 [Mycena olivaceomarginata]